MNINKIIAYIYIFHSVSIMLHELGHWFVAKRVYRQYEEVSVGNFFFVNVTKKFQISPIILSGYVSVSQNVILYSSKSAAISFFGIGPFVNLILAGVGLLMHRYGSIFFLMIVVNIIHFIVSILPIEGTDGYNLIKVLIYKSKYDNI